MKKTKAVFWILLATVVFASCGKMGKQYYEDAASFSKLKKELSEKFGKDASYSSLAVMNDANGSQIIVKVTKDPSSLEMTEWINVNGSWKQTSEVTLEITGDAKPEDFMFQLDKGMNMDLLGNLVEASKQKVISEKKIDEVSVSTVSLNAPDDGDFSTTKYFIVIEPKQGGTSFKFWYNLDGTLNKFDY